jgi:hypothetical protein
MKRIPNNKILRIALPVLILVWTLFKYCYPYANFFTDSYTYVQAAADRELISYRPIGYSVFLNAVHSLSTSDTFLVTLQYGLIQTACGYLFFTLRRRFSLSVRTEWFLLAFLLLDPVILYVSNCVSSDALFIALSLVWMVELIELAHRPSWWRMVLQVILLSLIFFIRYNALYYPVVAAFAYLWAPKGLVFRLTGITGSILIVVAGTTFTKEVTRVQTGAPVFSAFSGWQMANNALHIVPYVPAETIGTSQDVTASPSPECRELAALVRQYFDSAGPLLRKNAPAVTTSYMWVKSSPLRQYFEIYKKRNNLPYFTAWNRVSTVFTQYGYFLVRRHPLAFIRYYCWPGAKEFLFPPLGVLEQYNDGIKEVDPIAQKWFHYKTRLPTVCSSTIQASILRPFTWLYGFINGAFVIIALLFLRDKGLRARNPAFTAGFALITVFFLANTGFSILASPNEIRYQVLPLILLFMFTVGGISVWRAHRRSRIG